MRFGIKTFTVACAVAVTVLAGCSDKKQSVERAPVPVQTMVAEPTVAYRWIDTFGQTEGAQEVQVRAQVSGVLRQLHFTEGSTVTAGQVLFEIEPEPYVAALKQAKAQTQKATTDANKARRDLKRAKDLIGVGAISRQDYDAAINAHEAAQASLALAQAAEDKARIDLTHARVPAPVTGIAGKSEVNIGALVTAGSTLLTSITQPQELRVSFAISDRDLAKSHLTLENRVQIHAPGLTDVIEGQLDYIGQQVDADRGTLRLRAKLPAGTRLLPGQYVEVRLMAGVIENAFTVPQGIVKQKSDGTYAVYVLRDGLAREQEVFVSHWEGTQWVLTGGLKAGDVVITDQILRLRDRTKVTVKESSVAPTVSGANVP